MNQHHSKNITLRHLLVNNQKMIGLQFYPDKVIQALIKELPEPKWSANYNMVYIKNCNRNLKLLFEKFKGVVWLNCNYFYENKPISEDNEAISIEKFTRKDVPGDYRNCPKNYLEKLILKKYSKNTVKSYLFSFELFINHYKDRELISLDENDVRTYLHKLIEEGKSNSTLNLTVNSIKFYYEVVLGMPNRFYNIERPRKETKLPDILSKQQIISIINNTNNIKHKCILSLLYSAGLRRSELLNLKIEDINSDRMLIHVKNTKGNKSRYTLLSINALHDLRIYYKKYRPKHYLFEGINNQKYSSTSVEMIVKRAAKKAKIYARVTPHMFRHSFATHLLESGTDLRYIQTILGHSSSKTTEIYTRVATNNLQVIKNPLDL